MRLLAVGLGGIALAQAAEPADNFKLNLGAPLEYQVFQRASATDGTIRVEGAWSSAVKAAAPPDGLEGRVLRSQASAEPDDKTPWRALPFDSRAKGFLATLAVAPGGWYRLEVRLRRGREIVATAGVQHVGVGEVFVIAGQSNSANYGEVRQQPASGLVVAFDGEHWHIADDPQPGATGTKGSFIPSFGDALVRRLGVPVGVACVGVGSTSVREWLPAGRPMTAPPTTGAHCLALADGKFASTGELFSRLATCLRAFPAGGVRAVLWHQGESDWNQAERFHISLEEYRADLAALIASSRSAAGWDVPWVVAQASYHNPADPGSAEFRAQQLAVTDGRLTFPGPNTDELPGSLREKNGQGVHFGAEGLRRHGEAWAEVVGNWLAASGAKKP